MVFVSDKQRKFVMAKLRQGKAIVEPTIIKLSPAQQKFIRKKVSKNIKEGRKPKQAVAISFSQARKKFGNGALLPSKERVAIKKLRSIIPKLNKKQTEELRKIVLKKLKKSAKKQNTGFLLDSPEARFKVISKKGSQLKIEITRGNLEKTGFTRGDRIFVKRNEVFLSNPANQSSVPLINLIPLLIGTFVILSVLKASQDIFKRRKKSR